ncbi:MAG TPA: HD domain-containing protein [Candidatus Nanoarchaeia archaeon]
MEAFIRFFIDVNKLKFTKRPGWVLRGIKNPESVASHAFRVLVLAWVFGLSPNRNIKRLLKLALVHSLSAAYIEYISPYEKLLKVRGKQELIKKYPALVLRGSKEQKEKIAARRFHEEETAVRKLIHGLPEPQKNEIYSLWLDFQHKSSHGAKFLKTLDRVENSIQAIEYRGQLSREVIYPFLSQIDEITDNKRILGFAKSIEEFFTKGRNKVRNKKNAAMLEFLCELGKLKQIKRIGWIYGGAEEEKTESIADHSFRVALMCWVLAARRRMDLEKVLKMAIVHDIVIIFTGDITPFDDLISGDPKKDKKILEEWPTRSKKEKERLTVKRRYKEREALDKLLKDLPAKLRDEILSLWFEYEEGFSKEGRFVRQVDRIEKLLQAIEYKAKGIYKPKLDPYWAQLKLLLDDPILIEFVENIDKWYFSQRKGASMFVDKEAQS